jgi:hypothetical protein
MAIAQPVPPEVLDPADIAPNIDHIVTEDDAPVDNIFSEKQQRLLTESLYSSWPGPGAERLGQQALLFFGKDVVHRRIILGHDMIDIGRDVSRIEHFWCGGLCDSQLFPLSSSQTLN